MPISKLSEGSKVCHKKNSGKISKFLEILNVIFEKKTDAYSVCISVRPHDLLKALTVHCSQKFADTGSGFITWDPSTVQKL